MLLSFSETFGMKKIKCEVAKAENLEYMSVLKSDTIDLIYIDPPINTQKIQRNTQQWKKEWPRKVLYLQYYDSFGDGTQGYLEFMRPRLNHCHRLLKPTGILCVHLDLRSVHYIKCMLDEIFGYGDIEKGQSLFLNEIIWSYNRWSAESNYFQKIHDNILIYSKTKDYTFNVPYKNHEDSALKEYRYYDDEKGNRVRLSDIVNVKIVKKKEKFLKKIKIKSTGL